ncbi:hypothetical protein AB833_03375 [Chromatiales bacterium (ex Bugula neritina AB1)]|nr:hypothetical protein AB833_03375 [Chromatiales bacterium (ex Bugula neritina AB1)]
MAQQYRARKRFGQNFLVDHQIISQIISCFANSTNPIIEIGPGRGALTAELLKIGVPLIALELDRDLIPILQREYQQHDNFDLRQADALTFDFTCVKHLAPIRLVGNLPYNVATPLIFRLLEDISWISDMHFMLQWEVVARLSARRGDSHYGQLSLVVQNLCETTTLLEVPPTAFTPSPKVNSGVIHLKPRAQPLVSVEQRAVFNALVKSAFAQRRKTLRNNLKGILDEKQISDSGVEPGLRAEAISMDGFIRLTQTLVDARGSAPD